MSATPSEDKASSYGSPTFQRIPGVLTFLIPISAVLALILISPDFSRSSGYIFSWFLWLVFFTILGLSDNSKPDTLWYSYRNLAVMATWLSIGLPAALLLVVVSSVVVLAFRLWRNRVPPFREHMLHGLNTLLLTSIPLLAAALVYTLFQGQLPLTHVAVMDAIPLIAALFIDFIAVQVVRYVLLTYLMHVSARPIWFPEERPRLLAESVLSPLIIVLPLILYGSGTGVFTIILVMIAAYAIRYHETVRLAVAGNNAYRQSAELLQKLGLVSQAVRDSMFNVDRDVTVKSACQTAVQVTQADGAAIYLFEDDLETLKLAASYGLDPSPSFVLEAMLAATRQPLIVGNASTSPLVKGNAVSAFVQMPLGSESVPLGYLLVYHAQHHTYKPTEVELLEILSSQLAAALDNIQLLSAMEFHTFEMTHMVHLSRISASSLELDVVAAQISYTLHQMISSDSVMIALLENMTNRLHVLGIIEDKSTIESHTPAYMLPQFPEVQELRQQSDPHSVIIQISNPKTSVQLKSFMERDGLVEVSIVPLIAYQNMFGVILLGSTTARSLKQHESDLIEAAANQIATQIYNVQQYNTTREALERQLQQLALIEDIVQHISSTHSFNEIISDVFEAAIQSTQADMVALALVTEADDFWVIEQDYEDARVFRHDSSQSKHEGIIGQVGRTGQIILTPDNSEVADYLPPVYKAYASSLAVPIQKNGEVVGVLNVESRQKHFFNMNQADFLKNLGGHAMISIENNRLLEELHFQIDTLTSLRELSLVLSSAIDTQSVGHAVLQSALQMLQGDCAVLFRYSPLNGDLQLVEKIDRTGATISDGNMAVLMQAVREAATTGETQSVEDTAKRYAGQLSGAVPYASLMASPILREGNVNEVLCIGFSEPQQFESREVNTLALLASQAAGHLENAALHEKIRETNNRMKAILDSTRDGIIFLDDRGRLAEVNPAAQRLMGIPLSDYVNESFVDILLRHAESEQEALGGYSREEMTKLARIQRLDPEGPTRREFTHKIPPNQALYIQESGSPVVSENQQTVGRLLVLRDITDEKLVEIYREEITSMAVHDLRSPLAAIIDALRIALDNIDKPGGVAIATQTINLASVSADKLMGLVNSLLELRRSRQMELDRSTVAVDQLVEAARQTLASTAEKAQIPVEISIPKDAPPVNVDADKVRRVLINLLDNALRYTPSGKPVQIRVLVEPRSKLTVQVADSGPGIPEKERERIFEQFWQVKENQPLRGTKGNGIGLTFCQRVIEAHGERIWVEAHGPLAGACFSFTLPTQPVLPPNGTEIKR